jgi:hypothetical protein
MSSKSLQYISGEISVHEYWEFILSRMDFSEICAGCEPYAERLRQILDAGFWRLHALDRSDPFWNQTNRLATKPKLGEFADDELKKEPTDAQAAWLAIVVELTGGSDYMQPDLWRVLLSAGQLDGNFLVFTAWNMHPYWFDLNIGRLASLVRSLRIEGLVAGALESLASRGEEEREWVSEVNRILAGN